MAFIRDFPFGWLPTSGVGFLLYSSASKDLQAPSPVLRILPRFQNESANPPALLRQMPATGFDCTDETGRDVALEFRRHRAARTLRRMEIVLRYPNGKQPA
ncbi:MAG: hypothetical protein ABSE48_22640 [Verrucomicrobiota bacterium]